MMNILFAPLRLPQRIRTPYTPALKLTDYYNRVDALNGIVGHSVFTRFRRGVPDNCDDWSTIHYGFRDKPSQIMVATYINHVHEIHYLIQDTIVQRARAFWDDSQIDWSYDREYLMFDSMFLRTSISI
jgi:hypothetical protein